MYPYYILVCISVYIFIELTIFFSENERIFPYVLHQYFHIYSLYTEQKF